VPGRHRRIFLRRSGARRQCVPSIRLDPVLGLPCDPGCCHCHCQYQGAPAGWFVPIPSDLCCPDGDDFAWHGGCGDDRRHRRRSSDRHTGSNGDFIQPGVQRRNDRDHRMGRRPCLRSVRFWRNFRNSRRTDGRILRLLSWQLRLRLHDRGVVERAEGFQGLARPFPVYGPGIFHGRHIVVCGPRDPADCWSWRRSCT
jgi:hypothetical protein